jgi:hypothetical protein
MKKRPKTADREFWVKVLRSRLGYLGLSEVQEFVLSSIVAEECWEEYYLSMFSRKEER